MEKISAAGEIAVQFDSVSFSYGSVPVFENISFHLHRGEFTALTGHNGSGKTTILRLILGLEQPSGGNISLFGIQYGQIGYVPQRPPADLAFPISVLDVVRMGQLRPMQRYSAQARAAALKALEITGMDSLSKRPWSALSGGQRQRVLVARALVSQPQLLILDEPASGLDKESEEQLFETLGRLKGSITILIVTHNMNYVSALADRVLGMDLQNRQGIAERPNDCCEYRGR